MDEIDIECTHSNVLKETSAAVLLCERILIVTEEHEHNDEQNVHGCSSWKVCPLELECVPLENVGTAEHDDDRDEWEEPLRVEQSLPTVPISVDNISEDEEVEIFHRLDKARIVEE